MGTLASAEYTYDPRAREPDRAADYRESDAGEQKTDDLNSALVRDYDPGQSVGENITYRLT
jgi:hypothetical protein